MIVVDSNVPVYLYLPGALTAQAEKLRVLDPEWVAPRLWRSEMRSALTLYVRTGLLTLDQACRVQAAAEFDVPSLEVFQLVGGSSCSAYDCEFVALAKRLGVMLVTSDKKVLKAFPETAISLAQAVA